MNSQYKLYLEQGVVLMKFFTSFGFLDGISNPAVEGFDTKPNPGQETVPQSVILLGHDKTPRPAWAVNGSFLVFRFLFQLVPEFNDFLKKNPIVLGGLTREQGSELLGARLMGRWKSGTYAPYLTSNINLTNGSE